MRHDYLYLADIIEAAEAIEKFLHGVKSEDFTGNDLLRSAVLQKLSIIGEAAARISKDLQNKYPQIEWADIVAFRNIAIHAYFAVDWSIVWTAATHDAPDLKRKVTKILGR